MTKGARFAAALTGCAAALGLVALTMLEDEAAPAHPASPRVVAAGGMGAARAAHQATLLEDGRVLITGGERATGAAFSSAEVFDPDTSTFSIVGEMTSPRGSHVASPLPDGRVLVVGGHRASGQLLRSAEVFDPTTGQFEATGAMAEARHKHAAAPLPDGKILIIGGSDVRDYRGRIRGTELYAPATGEFSPGPEMRWARHKIRDAVVALPSGAVVVAGGAARPELWDPTDGIFVPAEGELSGPQMFATATLLISGEVLVLGGYDERIDPSAAAWLVRAGP